MHVDNGVTKSIRNNFIIGSLLLFSLSRTKQVMQNILINPLSLSLLSTRKWLLFTAILQFHVFLAYAMKGSREVHMCRARQR